MVGEVNSRAVDSDTVDMVWIVGAVVEGKTATKRSPKKRGFFDVELGEEKVKELGGVVQVVGVFEGLGLTESGEVGGDDVEFGGE